MSAQGTEEATGSSRPHGRTTAEWTLFAATLAVVLAVAVTAIWLWLSGSSRPPAFTVTVDSPVSVAEAVHTPVAVTNTGTETAASVQIVARDDEGRQVLSQTIDYISGGETATITFVLPQPRPGLTFSVGSFQPP